MPNVINYVDQFDTRIRSLYDQELFSNDLFNTNPDVKMINAKTLKVPTMRVSGYKDHTRAGAFNAGTYENAFETKTLDHDRDIEFAIDPMDVDETNQILTTANIHSRFEKTQAIPELDCYTFSKIYSEFVRAGGTVKTAAITDVLADWDENVQAMKENGVPLSRCILYCTTAYEKMLKNAAGITRTLNVGNANGIDRRILSLDDLGKIVVVPSARFHTLYDFSDGYEADASGKLIDYILIDPEAQVSRVKYSYIHMFTPGSDSRTADNYLYQNRRYNGTFALVDADFKKGCIIHTAA